MRERHRRAMKDRPHQRAHQHPPHQNPSSRNKPARRGIACALLQRTQDPSDADTTATPFAATALQSDPRYRISALDPLDPTYQSSPARPFRLAPPTLQPSPRLD